MRLFVAIQIPADVRAAFAVFLKDLAATAPRVKWVRAENLHVTLKFLGNTDPAKLLPLQKVLASVHSPEPVTLDFHGLGFFPGEKRPRVFWAGLESSPNLKSLAQDVDRAVHNLGYPMEDRPFAPHLTLARFNPPGMPPMLSSAAHENATRSFGSFTAREFHLIESKLKPTGAEYTTLHSFPFVAEA
ncbi:MAG: RNA 2',3'-cyclic phosphodiesterase [Candidatus Acidiferrum sp.]